MTDHFSDADRADLDRDADWAREVDAKDKAIVAASEEICRLQAQNASLKPELEEAHRNLIHAQTNATGWETQAEENAAALQEAREALDFYAAKESWALRIKDDASGGLTCDAYEDSGGRAREVQGG